MQQAYPEKLPNNLQPVENFTFTLAGVSHAREQIGLQRDALYSRIDKIIENFQLDGKPVIAWILNLGHDKEQLKGVSKGLDRVADLINDLDDLERKEITLETAESHPDWFAGALGDFSTVVETALTDFIKGSDNSQDDLNET
jgi:hypothetical protein